MTDDLRALARNGDLERTYEIRTLPTVPVAGQEWSFTVPGGEVWHVHAIHATFATSAVAGSRVPSVVMDDGTTRVARYVSSAQAANVSNEITWDQIQVQNIAVAGGNVTNASIPLDLILLPGWRLRSVTATLDGGDLWSGVAVTSIIQRKPADTVSHRLGISSDMLGEIIEALTEGSK